MSVSQRCLDNILSMGGGGSSTKLDYFLYLYFSSLCTNGNIIPVYSLNNTRKTVPIMAALLCSVYRCE